MYSELCPNSWIQHVDRVWYDKPRDQLLVTNSVWASGFFALYFSKHWDKFPSVVNVRSTTEVRLNSMNGKVHCNSNRFLIIREQPWTPLRSKTATKLTNQGTCELRKRRTCPSRGKRPVANCILWKSVRSPVATSLKIWTSPRLVFGTLNVHFVAEVWFALLSVRNLVHAKLVL